MGRAADGDRIKVKAAPWATFSLADEAWRQWLAEVVEEHQFDVVVAGPLTRIGMDGAGTLQEVAAFMDLIGEVRSRCSRRFATVVPHHEGKSGSVSGAWEGAPETLLHVQAAGHGRTVVFVQKARWGSELQGKTLSLAWAPGETFTLEGDRDYKPAIVAYLAQHPRGRTVKEIAAPTTSKTPGIGAAEGKVEAVLKGDPETFEMRTGEEAKALGRKAGNSKVWMLRSAPNAADAPGTIAESVGGAGEGAALLRLPEGERSTFDAAPPGGDGSPECCVDAPTQHDAAAVRERLRLVVDQPPDDEQPESEPEHMYQRVAAALERELAHGQKEYNGTVRDRLRAQGLKTHPAMIADAEGPLEERGLRIDKKRDWTQNGRFTWQLLPLEQGQPDQGMPREDILGTLLRWNESRRERRVITAIARAVERQGGTVEDARDLALAWERLEATAQAKADRDAGTRQRPSRVAASIVPRRAPMAGVRAATAGRKNTMVAGAPTTPKPRPRR